MVASGPWHRVSLGSAHIRVDQMKVDLIPVDGGDVFDHLGALGGVAVLPKGSAVCLEVLLGRALCLGQREPLHVLDLRLDLVVAELDVRRLALCRNVVYVMSLCELWLHSPPIAPNVSGRRALAGGWVRGGCARGGWVRRGWLRWLGARWPSPALEGWW